MSSTKEKEIGDDYSSSLADLTVNSKPLINMLTILAEESIDHAAVIVQSVEKHLDKVHAEMKLPVLYLVDSIIKNVGGAYTQLFSQTIVSMFCKVFKQVDEKTRSQMFKLRETWHDVFPSIKLYQLDVKVNVIDPAWPIQVQPPQSNIHVNPNFFKKSTTSNVISSGTSASVEEEKMRNAVALKEQELLLLQKKKVELELEQAKKMLQQSSSQDKKGIQFSSAVMSNSLPSAVVAVPSKPKRPINNITTMKPTPIRIAPANPALISQTSPRDPRRARHNVHNNVHVTNSVESLPTQNIGAFDSKPFVKTDKINRFIKPSENNSESSNKIDNPKLLSRHVKKDSKLVRNKISDVNSKLSKSVPSKRSRSPNRHESENKIDKKEKPSQSPDSSKIISSQKLPPIPKIKAKNISESIDLSNHSTSPKRRKENSRSDRTKKSKSSSSERKHSRSPVESPKKTKRKPSKYESMDIDLIDSSSPPPSDVTTFKELKFSTKERNYIRRNREKSESPETIDVDLRSDTAATTEKYAEPLSTAQDSVSNGVARKDIDFRVIPKNDVESTNNRKRSPADKRDVPSAKKNRTEKFDELFGNADVDLRKLPIVDNLTPPPSTLILPKESNENIAIAVNFENEKNGGWAKVKEIQSPQGAPMKSMSHLDIVKAKLAEATKGKDRLGRPFLYSSSDETQMDEQLLNFVDTDMRQPSVTDLDKDNLNETISSILSQAEEQFKNGIIDKQQYNTFLMQVMQLNETQKLKEAQQKESLEKSKRRKDWKQKQQNLCSTEAIAVSDEDVDGTYSPQSDETDVVSPQTNFGDIDERIAPPVVNSTPNVEGGKRPPLLPCPDIPYMDCDLRMYDKPDGFMPRGIDSRYPGRPMGPRMYKGWRGMRPDRGGYRPMPPRGLLPPPMMNARRMPMGGMRPPFEPRQQSPPFAPKGPFPGIKQMTCPVSPYINDGKASPPPLGAPSISRGFVPVDSKVIEYIEQDTMRTIHIDGVAREIRYYDNTAVVMLDWDDPREISFEAGQRRISFDDESFILNLNGDYTNVTIDGQSHRIRFGAPTRELFIDDYWFECFFGGPPMQIIVNNKVKHLKLEGPPPQVSIGKTKRTDLVAGKINLIIDATTMLPIFLDAKLQKFEIENISHTIRFVDSLQTVLINEKPFKVEFGGLPKPLFVGKRKHFVRFSVLPRDVKAGHIYIKNMEGKKPAILPTPTNDLSFISTMSTINSDALTLSNNVLEPVHKPEIVQDNYNIGNSNVKGGLDMLASVMPSLMAPPSQYGGYSVLESSSKKDAEKGTSIPGLGQDMSVPPPNINSILQNVNVDDLFAKLVASGIVSTLPNVATVPSQETVESTPVASTKVSEKTITKSTTNVIKPVDIMKSETLKVRQPGLISLLHTGMQCGGCGARFPPEHTVRYSQHLDWHFRQNRADRHSQRRPNSRRWYYDISDWIQYQEIEDLEEREKSWFEREQQAAEAAKSEEAAAVAARRETSSVPLPSDASPEKLRCYLCHDNFHQFYNHDIDEWHLRNAVEFEGNNYHPICLDDHKASLIAKEQEKLEECKDESLIELDKETNESTNLENEDSPMKDLDITEPETQDTSERDNESVVEVLSEEANTQESNTDEAPDVELVEEDDDDVVIKNEPIEQIIVDDVDTDEETENERRARDQEIPIDFANVKIKQEPIDPDDEPIITSEGVMTAQADTTHAAVLSSIDGNVQLEPTAQNLPNIPAGGIRINITKPLINLQQREKEVAPKPSEPVVADLCPPGEEANTTYKLKPGLEGVTFAVQPPSQKGSELSGLCSVM